jgi:uncharacterized protein YrzB (UPF0473 family)
MNDSDKSDLLDDEHAIYEVVDENGVRRELVRTYTFDHNQVNYVVLFDRNDTDADGFIMRMELDNEELVLSPIEDLDEWEAVEKIYEEISAKN